MSRIDDDAAPRRKPADRRVPPHDLQAEESLLGAMMLEPEAIATAAGVVRTDDFYKPAHAHIFDAVHALYAAGQPVDPVTVADELRRGGLLDVVGGHQALVQIMSSTPATTNAAGYARIIEEHALLRRLIGVAGEIAELGYGMPDDVTKALDRAESLVYHVNQRRVTDTTAKIEELLGLNLDRLEQLYGQGDAITGVPTGYADLDDLLSGLQPSNLVIVGARPSMGKTSFALGMAAHAAMSANYPVLVFSLEMGNLELSQRMLCGEARIDSARVRTGRLNEDDWNRISQAIGRLAAAPIWIDDNPNVTVMEIRAKARRLRSQVGNLGMVVVDYLQLMSGRGSAENRQVEVSEMSRGLKILARELECPVVALSQLSRQLEMRADKRPMLADLRESGCLTADARVLRADTGAEVTIGELAASGERDIPVWSLDTDLRMVPATMTHAFPTGVKEVFDLRLASGRQVMASANHPFLTVDGWLRLDELSPGSRIAVPRRVAQPKEAHEWPEHEVILLAQSLYGGRSHEKFVPPPVFALSDDQIALFLGHLWATDGCVGWWGQGRIYYASTSRRLVDDVQLLLLRLGIRSTLRQVPGSPDRPGYQLHIDGRDEQLAFLDQVRVVGQRGPGAADLRRRLGSISSNANVDTIPVEVWRRVRDLMAGKGITTRRFAAELGTAHCGSTLYRHAPSRSRFGRVAEIVDDDVMRSLATSDVFWDRIVAIEPRGAQPVYDAAVEGTHNFVANGITVENSIEQDADVVMFIYRDDVYHTDSPDRGQAEIIVAKHRNGPTGVCRLAFLSQFTRFANMARVD
jgi:replicative DNA helicase